MKEEIIVIFALLSLTVVCVSVGYFGQEDISSLVRKATTEKIETPKQCINLSMEETSYCLNDHVNSIFQYKETDDKRRLTLEELKEEGGDCKDWSELYMKYIDNLNFYSEIVIIDTNEKEAHAFVIISDDTGYCKLDQMDINCFRFG